MPAGSKTGFDAIAYINEPRWAHSVLGLDRIRSLLEALGDPQDDLRFVHVAGTNGKGSTCAYIASILQCAGYSCGLFTSPYIERFEERIRVNGDDISSADLTEATLRVKEAAEVVERRTGQHPTEFELMCAVALVHFARRGCDIVVMEVGLGGRLDSTNVIEPELCVITRIGLDHCAILGGTIEQIAAEKAGIIKPGVPVVSAPQDASALRVIERTCREIGCELFLAPGAPLEDDGIDLASGARRFTLDGTPFTTSMIGAYQLENAATAIVAARVLGKDAGRAISDADIGAGIASARWPGRFEIIATEPLFIVDGAHNPDGVRALARSLGSLQASTGASLANGITFVAGVLADKDRANMIGPLLPFASSFITYTPSNPRALPGAELARSIEDAVDRCDVVEGTQGAIAVISCESAAQAVRTALEHTSPEGLVVAFGTLYSIAEIKQAMSS